ncbi:GNAT family N-acetyltransferase [Agaribacter flavus]|uniref:GNAT family N-acetyltransferase n=1 Tax=Agaribacter flavus TaxID=1902781 RepID=A0ABV7FVW7_9ALTE
MKTLVLSFSELSINQLYAVLRLRSEVFVVEQNCVYQDIDNRDLDAMHVLFVDNNGVLLAYARLLPADLTYSTPSIGRIIVAPQARGNNLGKQLVTFCVKTCERLWANQDIKIGAQCYLENFYNSFGFLRVSEDYLEDGIPHLDMLLSAQK